MYIPIDGRALPQELGEEEFQNDVEDVLILDSDGTCCLLSGSNMVSRAKPWDREL